MSIWKKGKKWYTDWRDRQGKRHRKSYPTRGQAERADKGIKQWKRREGPKPRDIPTSKLLDDFKASRAHLGTDAKRRDLKWATRILLAIGQTPFDQVEPRHFAQLREWLGSHYHFNARKTADNAVTRFLRWLHKCGHLPTDPKTLWEPIHQKSVFRTVTIDPVTILRLKGLANPLQLLIVMLGYHAGMRREEMCRALVSDWNRDAQTLTIHSVKGTPVRVVPIGNELAAFLGNLTRGNEPDAKLTACCAAQGNAVSTSYLNVQWRDLCESAGIGGIWIHDLRRTWASDLGEVGSVTSLMQLAGWQRLQSAEHYLHSRPNDVRRAAMALDARRDQEITEQIQARAPISETQQ